MSRAMVRARSRAWRSELAWALAMVLAGLLLGLDINALSPRGFDLITALRSSRG